MLRPCLVLFLLLFFGLAVHAMQQHSPTFDEQGFLVRGLGYIRNENRWMRVGHPAGLNLWNALLLWRDPQVALPSADPSWQLTSFHRPGELFLWEIGNDVARVMFLGRLPTVWLGLLLIALVARFARDVTGRTAPALFALALVALDPNLLAHSGLATTDLGLVTAAVAATWGLWRLLRRPTLPRAVLAGALFGLLQNTKFTAGLFLPLLVLLALIGLAARPKGERLTLFGLLAGVYPLAAFLTLWGCYGFEIGRLPDQLPALSAWLGGRTLPLAHHIEQLSDLGGRMAKATPAFLLGRYSDNGWWFYFPVALALKTPLPTLLAGLAGLIALLPRRLPVVTRAALTIPPLGFFGFALTNDINIGYRHILVLVPFLALWAAIGLAPWWRAAATPGKRAQGWRTVLPWLLIAGVAQGTLRTAPHLLAAFNALAGGPDNGWRTLVDSNIDWGQDLGNLARWQREAGDGQPLWLSYFGVGHPDYYGLAYRGLPSFPPRLMHPEARTFHPDLPAPGRYAISATNLQGVLFDDRDLFGRFRAQEPPGKVGYSIFLYDVAATGPPVAVSLGSVQIDEVPSADLAPLGSNDLRLRWFSAPQALLLPADSPDRAVVLLPESADLPPTLAAWLDGWGTSRRVGALRQVTRTRTLAELWRVLPGWERSSADFRHETGAIRLHGWQLETLPDRLRLTTVWEQRGEPQPVKLFVHLLTEGDTPIAQWDGLGTFGQFWPAGDWLVQSADLPLPDPATGRQLRFGLYHPDGPRWLLPDGRDFMTP
jgi:hypothetical protein